MSATMNRTQHSRGSPPARILAPFDSSAASRSALPAVAERARRTNAEVALLLIQERSETSEQAHEADLEADKLFGETVPLFRNVRIVRRSASSCAPAEAILAETQSSHSELVMMGITDKSARSAVATEAVLEELRRNGIAVETVEVSDV